MKKIVFVLVALMGIIINFTYSIPETKNKGSGDCNEMIILVPPMSAEIVMPTTAMTADDDWIQQQNSSSDMMLKLSYAMMNNTNELMGIADLSPRGFVMMIAESMKIPEYLVVETSVEVTKIPNLLMVLNSSNTQRPGSLVVPWRQNSIDMMTREVFEMDNGANECNVKDGNSYNSYSTGNKSFPHLPVTV